MESIDKLYKSTIIFRADGCTELGLGHIVRCSALAEAYEKNYNITFVSRTIPSSIKKDFEDRGWQCFHLKCEDDILTYLTRKSIVIQDHYNLGTQWQNRIRATGAKLVCIDDMMINGLEVDLLLNHNPYVSQEEYQGGNIKRFALGLDFALVRNEFKLLASEKLNKSNEKVIICLGGSDLYNITTSVVQCVLKALGEIDITVVVGQSYLHRDKLDSIAQTSPSVHLRQGINAKEMSNLFRSSSIAILSASGVLIEALSGKCRIIACYYAENQRKFHDHLDKDRVILSFGDNSKQFQENKLIACLHSDLRLNEERITEFRNKIARSNDKLTEIIKSL